MRSKSGRARHQPECRLLSGCLVAQTRPARYQRVLGTGRLVLVAPRVAQKGGYFPHRRRLRARVERFGPSDDAVDLSARSAACSRLAGRQRRSFAARSSVASGALPPTSSATDAASSSTVPRAPSRPRRRWRRLRLRAVGIGRHIRERRRLRRHMKSDRSCFLPERSLRYWIQRRSRPSPGS